MFRTVLWIATFIFIVSVVTGQRKIVGGRAAPIGRTPWLVSIREKEEHVCGGAIIGQRTILTAGHCVAKLYRTMSIRAGSNRRDAGGVIKRVAGWRRHPCYKKKRNTCDLALVFLRENLQFGNRTQPIPLYDKKLHRNQVATIAGWGLLRSNGRRSPKFLQITTARITPRKTCRRVYRKLRRSQFCAGYMKGGRDSCQGDSGGPLVIDGQLAGVISDGVGCAKKGFPGIYTRILMFKRWIRRYA